MSLLPGFVKAQSDNLPKIDEISVVGFLRNNADFTGAELRGAKLIRSGDERYGENAIGRVQVKRENNICSVVSSVTPEHKVSKPGYKVTLTCKEEEGEVLSVECDGCAASLGGCKHAVALLFWVHRRSLEPSVTEVSCYWKESKLSTIGSSLKFIKGKDIGKKQSIQMPPKTGTFLASVIKKSGELGRETVLTNYYTPFTATEKLSIHLMMLNYFQLQQASAISSDVFLEFCTVNMSAETCAEASELTMQQAHCKLWHELRYARITASKAHESAHCHTLDGTLVNVLLGASKIKDTVKMKPGRNLKKKVRKEVGKKLGIKIVDGGFYTMPEYPIMGASPNGMSEEYVVEIKCPNSEKAIEKYIANGQITPRYLAQMQLQMFLASRQKGLFCVASQEFETSKEVFIHTLSLDEQYCHDLIQKCTQFWKLAIFPVLKKYKK